MRRSQLAIFFILAILIIILSLFLFIKKPIAEEESKELASFKQTKELFENYVNQCLYVTTDRAIKRYGFDYINEQLEDYSENHILECMDGFNQFKKLGFDVIFPNPEINITISNRKVESVMAVEAELIKNTNKAEFERFKKTIFYPEDFNPHEGFEWKYRGILYKYEKMTGPRPNDIFIAKIDLEDKTIRYYVTPKIAPNLMITSQFLMGNKLQFAVNGGGFDIGGTNVVNGYSAYNGEAYSPPEVVVGETVFVTEDNEVFLDYSIPDRMKYAVSGFNFMVDEGKVRDRFADKNHPDHKPGYDNLEPRTTIGKDEKDGWLIVMVIDGRNPGVSEGLDLKELGELHVRYGSTRAFNMDGGGSSTFVMQEGNSFKVFNNPSDGAERPVANHFGVYAETLPAIEKENAENLENVLPIPGGDDGNSILKFRTVSAGIGAGGQPSAEGYKWLASQGYKTVIDVQGIDNSAAVNAAGMNYIYLPYNGNPPTASWANSVISAMNTPSNKPVYIHCQYGEHRTGVAIALYRELIEGVCYQQAYNELMSWADNYFPGTEQEKTAVFEMIKSYSQC